MGRDEPWVAQEQGAPGGGEVKLPVPVYTVDHSRCHMASGLEGGKGACRVRCERVFVLFYDLLISKFYIIKLFKHTENNITAHVLTVKTAIKILPPLKKRNTTRILPQLSTVLFSLSFLTPSLRKRKLRHKDVPSVSG